jgi:hypothetical protein
MGRVDAKIIAPYLVAPYRDPLWGRVDAKIVAPYLVALYTVYRDLLWGKS